MINIIEIPTLYHYRSNDPFGWLCAHPSAELEYVTVNYDDAELVTVCNDCGAQLIGEEWV